MLLSLIIPVYNVEKYIEECLESVFNQLTDDMLAEIIIINDGTPDNSMLIVEKIIKKYENLDEKIKVINKENGGISSVRNLGISLAKGEYIAFLDSDDFLLDGYFKKIFKILSDKRVDFLHFNAMQINESGRIENLKFVDSHQEGKINVDFLKTLFEGADWYPWLRIIKKKLYNDKFFIDNIYMEDKILFPEIYMTSLDKIYYTYNEELICYRHRLGSAIRSGLRKEMIEGVEFGLVKFKPNNKSDINGIIYNQFFLQKIAIMRHKKDSLKTVYTFISSEADNIYIINNAKIFIFKYFKFLGAALVILSGFLKY